jgi:hypothetical protein
MTHDTASSSQTVEKHVSHKSLVPLVKQVEVQRKMEVLLLGYLDNPRIKCMKQLYN